MTLDELYAWHFAKAESFGRRASTYETQAAGRTRGYSVNQANAARKRQEWHLKACYAIEHGRS